MTTDVEQIHATCVAISGIGVLLRGVSGSGKSDLALRLIDDGAELVADDYVMLHIQNGTLTGFAPETLQGLLEVRGIGVLEVPWRANVKIWAVIDLVDNSQIDRMPEPDMAALVGLEVPHFQLDPWSLSAPAKVRLVSRLVSGSIKYTDD